ncbi:MAG: hypothetical protein ACR2MP_02105 [Streptosporangiaceae bacterium]
MSHAEGGYIGYCVLSGHRRRGYATGILRQSLVIARAHGAVIRQRRPQTLIR